MRRAKRKQLQVHYEPPFTDWLYHYVYKTIGCTYVVETQEENLKDVGMNIAAEEVNEYAKSRADLVTHFISSVPVENMGLRQSKSVLVSSHCR